MSAAAWAFAVVLPVVSAGWFVLGWRWGVAVERARPSRKEGA